ARDRLVAIRDAAGTDLVRIVWSAIGPSGASVMGKQVSFGYSGQAIGDAVAWAHGATNPGVVVELPAHLPAYWEAKIKTETAGSPAWRNAQRQMMVAAAAVNNRPAQLAAFNALRTSFGVEIGDLALASGGVATHTTDA